MRSFFLPSVDPMTGERKREMRTVRTDVESYSYSEPFKFTRCALELHMGIDLVCSWTEVTPALAIPEQFVAAYLQCVMLPCVPLPVSKMLLRRLDKQFSCADDATKVTFMHAIGSHWLRLSVCRRLSRVSRRTCTKRTSPRIGSAQ